MWPLQGRWWRVVLHHADYGHANWTEKGREGSTFQTLHTKLGLRGVNYKLCDICKSIVALRLLQSLQMQPLGTIARLVAKESNVQAVKVGSLSSLHESVSHLEEKHLWTHTCKEMLLQPRNSMEDYCQQPNLNIDDTEPMNHYFCVNFFDCIIKPPLLSTFRNQRCHCGKLMNLVVTPENMILEKGFVKDTATFIVSDDLAFFGITCL
ncbi:hypothetical protein CR513_52400, partial [Mucuna pruriens]